MIHLAQKDYIKIETKIFDKKILNSAYINIITIYIYTLFFNKNVKNFSEPQYS